MKRRELIRFSLLGVGAAVLLPRRICAGPSVHVGGPLAGSVYYTRESPGLWDGMVPEHLPRLEVTQGPGGSAVVTVSTQHEMDGYRHYIVKHKLLDAKFRVLGQKSFDPDKDRPVSRYSLLPGYRGPIYALSMCNRHDLWLEGVVV